jgi:hypothetical protein
MDTKKRVRIHIGISCKKISIENLSIIEKYFLFFHFVNKNTGKFYNRELHDVQETTG